MLWPFTWLYRIAVNEALQRARRRQLETRSLDEVVETEIAPTASPPLPADVTAEQREAVAFLAARLRALPIELRAPLVLRDIEGLSHREVADALGLTVSASKSRIHRARLQLGKEFARWRPEAP
jgi:RNA polymerase sigma-70 factor (ECF subfamily)